MQELELFDYLTVCKQMIDFNWTVCDMLQL